MSGAVKSIDHGYDALVKRVYGLEQPEVAIGILAKDAEEPKKSADGTPSQDGARVIDAAVAAEFGTDTEPERSFIRAWYDEANPRMRASLTALLRSHLAGKRTKEEVFELLGQKGVGEIQQRIAAGIPPENAASTIERKGSSTTLIASGQLRSAVSYAVKT